MTALICSEVHVSVCKNATKTNGLLNWAHNSTKRNWQDNCKSKGVLSLRLVKKSHC